jgi:DNA-binding response OmpR family regulator
MKVLLVEDDPYLSRGISKSLGERGHDVKIVASGTEAIAAPRSGSIDVAILDWVLPDVDGIGVLRAWRAAGVTVPVIMLTGVSETDAKVTGLRSGADDYLTKPFVFEELLARIEAIVRRRGTDGPITLGGTVIDPWRRTVSVGEASVKLSDRESALLATLARANGLPLSRAQLVERVWRGEPVNPNVVDVYVGYVRAKLEQLDRPGIAITAVRKVGFKLDLVADAPAAVAAGGAT